MSNTCLVLLGDYEDSQAGFTAAKLDGAVHYVAIDKQSYKAMFNVQQAIKATAKCLGGSVAIGLTRVSDDKYLPMSIVEAIDRDHFHYQNLDEAFEQAWVWHLEDLRKAVDNSLDKLAEALGDCEERQTIDHCTNCIEQQRK